MKTPNLYMVFYVIYVLVFFQSCQVYKKSSITLEQAAIKEQKVKILTKSGRSLKFKKIKKTKDQYYGVRKKHDDSKNIRLIENDVESIEIQDKTLSTIYTIVLPLVLVGGLVLLVSAGIGVF